MKKVVEKDMLLLNRKFRVGGIVNEVLLKGREDLVYNCLILGIPVKRVPNNTLSGVRFLPKFEDFPIIFFFFFFSFSCPPLSLLSRPLPLYFW